MYIFSVIVISGIVAHWNLKYKMQCVYVVVVRCLYALLRHQLVHRVSTTNKIWGGLEAENIFFFFYILYLLLKKMSFYFQ